MDQQKIVLIACQSLIWDWNAFKLAVWDQDYYVVLTIDLSK